MIAHTVLQTAMGARLATLQVCTTGTTALAATSAGFTRATGSFLTDGFAVGMEVTPSGFTANTARGVITAVTAGTLSIRGGCTVEAEAAGRSLVVGLPSSVASEGIPFTPQAGVPYLEEQYIPGPTAITNDGYAGTFAMRPMYAPRVYVPEGGGILGDGGYASAILALFAPGTVLTLTTGERLIVRADVAPYLGQRAKSDPPGWSTVPVTIPFEVRTTSSPS